MTPDDPEMDWVAERLPDVPEADPAATERARAEFLAYLTAAQPEPEPAPHDSRAAGPLQNARQQWRTHRLGPPRRRVAMLGAAAVAAAAAVVIGVDLTGGNDGHSVGAPAVAQAATIKARALSVLVPGPGGILEADVTEYDTNAKGVRTNHQGYEFWSMTSKPWAVRLLQTGFNGNDAESATTSTGRQQLYDRSTNTIEVLTPRYHFSPGPRPGTKRVTVPAYSLVQFANAKLHRLPAGYRHQTTTITVTTAQARQLTLPAASLAYRKSVHDYRKLGVVVVSDPFVEFNGYPGNIATQFTQPILQLLHSRKSTVNRHATLDGRPAISITQTGGPITAKMRKYGFTARTEYWIEPGSYRPLLEIQTSAQDPDANGHLVYSTSTTRFPRWRTLTGPAASTSLLSIAAQHPGARTIKVGVAAYGALSKKLYPTK